MKNKSGMFCTIALVAVIGFSMAALSLTGCDNGGVSSGGGGGGGGDTLSGIYKSSGIEKAEVAFSSNPKTFTAEMYYDENGNKVHFSGTYIISGKTAISTVTESDNEEIIQKGDYHFTIVSPTQLRIEIEPSPIILNKQQ